MQLRTLRICEGPKQAFFRRFRSNLPISLTNHNSTRLRLLTLDTPVSVLGTFWKFVRSRFSLRIEIVSDRPQLGGYSCFSLVLAVKAHPRGIHLNRTTVLPELSTSVTTHAFVTDNLASKYRNINLFPFRFRRLRRSLGTTNSWLTTYCQETLGLSADTIFTYLSCYYYQDLHWRTMHTTSQPCFKSNPTPSYRIIPYNWVSPSVSVVGLSPVHFLGQFS